MSWQQRHCCICQRSFSLRPHVHPPSLLFRLRVYRAYPYMARSLWRESSCGGAETRASFVNTAPPAQYKHSSSCLEADEDENTPPPPPNQIFRNLAIKNPMVSLSALQERGAAVPLWSQLSSGRNLWRRRSCSGDSPAPSMPSDPMWGS